MSTQSLSTSVNIEWDDSVVIVFSFNFNGTQFFCGFNHQIFALGAQSGSQTQVSPILAIVTQQAIQVSLDPQTWVETAKTAARGGKATIVFDDAVSTVYTTVTNQSFTLQSLFSLAG